MKRRTSVFTAIVSVLLILTSFFVFGGENNVSINASEVRLLKKANVKISYKIKNDADIETLSFKIRIPSDFVLVLYEVAPELDGICDCGVEDNLLTFFFHGKYKGNGKLITLTLYPLDSAKRGVKTIASDEAFAVMGGKRIDFAFSSDLLYRTCREHTPSGWIVTKEPTYEKEGSRKKVCEVCGKTLKTDTIKKREKRDISSAKVSYTKNWKYTGKKIKPTVTVKYKGVLLKENKDYELKYYSNIEKGKAKFTVIGIGAYKNKASYYFTIK